MKVIDILNKSDKAVFSFELVPPLKGGDINKIYEAIEPLIPLLPHSSTSPFTEMKWYIVNTRTERLKKLP